MNPYFQDRWEGNRILLGDNAPPPVRRPWYRRLLARLRRTKPTKE